MNTPEPWQNRPIPSFRRRQGRITNAQKAALQTLWNDYGINSCKPFSLESVFGRKAPVIMEIGFGNGSNIARSAQEHPEFNFLGVEVHTPGIGHLLIRIERLGLTNIRVYSGDALELLRDHIPDSSLYRINLYFPDPWPKKRHHKRRLVTPCFTSMVSRALVTGGCFHSATDWDDYARSMRKILDGSESLTNYETLSGPDRNPAPARNRTKFEKRGLILGHKVCDLIYQKTRNCV